MFCCIVIPDFHSIFVVLLFRHKISSPNFFFQLYAVIFPPLKQRKIFLLHYVIGVFPMFIPSYNS